ncbi:tRNA pseudouridine(38-40) synthase TruA [Pseudohongiella acticola]|jgi:tRNA pseudouridine38-40 synthase|uniref:tRNA pseudouridine(38-40) synthase TruA n=1 Tax=Pseudohongiella acticola TaxID=1524254 RepID=UPI0030EBCA1D
MTAYTTRTALGVEYNGAAFHGWQRQSAPVIATVQQALEHALSQIADQTVTVNCAGRTDTGVHGTGQVVHFESTAERGEKAWIQGTNSHLPPQVRVQWARTVSDDFHARHSALSRRYRYVIYTGAVRPAALYQQLTHVKDELDVIRMHEAAQHLLGENDFSAFRAAGCQSRTPMRCINELSVSRQRRFIVVEVEANAFLLHMVRNIVGALLEVGAGRRPPDWIRQVLATRDRRQNAVTAKPDGLYLVNVAYPERFGLPVLPLGPCFL